MDNLTVNTNVLAGIAAIIVIGVFVKLDLLSTQFANLALGTLLGAGARSVPDVLRGKGPEPE